MSNYLNNATIVSNHPDNRGLRALWLDQLGSSGLIMIDRVSEKYTLRPVTVNNTPTRSLSPFGGGAFRFASSSFQYMRSDTPVVAELPVAVCAWVYTFTNHNGTIWDCRRRTGGFTGFSISPRSNGAVRWYQNGGTERFTSTAAGAIPIGQWTRVCGVGVSATDYRVYINGVKVLTGTLNTGSTFTSVSNTNVGRYQAGGGSGEYFNGRLSDIRIWCGSEFTQDPDSFMQRDFIYSRRLENDPRLRLFPRRVMVEPPPPSTSSTFLPALAGLGW